MQHNYTYSAMLNILNVNGKGVEIKSSDRSTLH